MRAALDYELLRVTIGGGRPDPHAGIVAPPIRALTARCPSWLRTWTANALLDEAVMWMLTATAGGICRRQRAECLVLPVQQDPSGPLSAHRRSAQDQSEAVGVQTTMDEESVRSDHATEVRKQGTYELYIGYTSRRGHV